ncbi:MAG: NUDIX hydrolase [Acidobacteriota bacterium]
MDCRRWQYLWELPAGRLDEGETGAAGGATRAEKKRTGYKARKMTKLIEFWVSPGFLGEKMTIYLATGLTAGEQTPMEDERIETRWFTIAELDKMLDAGKLPDAKTQIGFLKWRATVGKRTSR